MCCDREEYRLSQPEYLNINHVKDNLRDCIVEDDVDMIEVAVFQFSLYLQRALEHHQRKSFENVFSLPCRLLSLIMLGFISAKELLL